MSWLTEARLGLFVHWGIYAAAARHEWVKSYEQLTDADYQPYFDHFEPDLYDPVRWAEDAWNAGMRYLVITTKHHDGFCLWDSKLTDYSAPNTPWGKDLLAPMVDVFRERGFKIGLYHSLLDWHHPEFPVDLYHPQRKDVDFIDRTANRDVSKYADYLHGQVRELLTGYGKIDVMWFDFSYADRGFNAKGPDEWRSEELLAMVKELQPGILVNNRLGLGSGDFTTPEQVQPPGNEVAAGNGTQVPWEACHTLNGSWGYHRDNHDWKSPALLIRMLVDSVSKGGNMLLNVGPNGRGAWEPRALDVLSGIGSWMRLHERSIRGCGPSAYVPPADCRYTQNGRRLYLHVFAWPMGHLHLPGLGDRVEYAQFLHDASEVKRVTVDPSAPGHTYLTGLPENTLTLKLPNRAPEVDSCVIELFLRD
ncbi:alpha-L-fucosidase [Kribbella shirazensis]|uniref:alpha-L-fucosidase n=1 Tax=Kribbella shirazensis TaxID=1105143 RepID=A0A7X5VGW3_9ACTN|nr:alpha-L-fucosidase [Kribbella shirazensis]NIK60988.1 alpha-L-fucosidase [Kribbella shirazensis]